MATVEQIKISNIGPVEHISIPVPAGGGVVVLRARNGKGKTRTLEAVESAISGRGKLEVRDGALSGSVDAFGVTIKVGRKATRSGELEVVSLEGRLSIAELVDPGLKSHDAADAKRIKALVQLANVQPSAALFYPLVGGRDEFDRHVGTAAASSDDLVQMADRIKRDLEAAARREESQAENFEGRARGCRESAAGVDVSGESDGSALSAKLEVAIREESRLKAETEAARKAKSLAQEARAQLEDAEAAYAGKSLADCVTAEANALTVKDADEVALREAEAALRRAQTQFETSRVAYGNAITARKQAEQHESMMAQWREQVQVATPTPPSAEALAAATAAVTTARTAVEQAGVVRRAKEQLATADKHADEAQAHRQAANRLRDAAKGTDEVLSEVVGKSGTKLRVEQGRLVLDTKRGATYFGELSHGERWKLALDIAIDAVGEHGVLTIPQEAYESLDPSNRQLIADHVAGTGVVIITAEASDDEAIRAEVYGTN